MYEGVNMDENEILDQVDDTELEGAEDESDDAADVADDADLIEEETM